MSATDHEHTSAAAFESTPELEILLDQYLAGECTAAQAREIETRAADDAEFGRWLATFREHRTSAATSWSGWNVDLVWHGLDAAARDTSANLGDRPNTRPPSRSIGARQHARSIRWVIGASVVALVTIVAGSFSARSFYTSSREATGALHTYQTASAQRSTIRLADGSTMILAPSTSVTVSPTRIDVDGQVYFTVTSHATRPFVVHTRTAAVRVLGTAFVVRQYANEPGSQIAVEDGKVSVETRHERGASHTPVILTPGMLARVADSGIVVSSDVPTRDFTSWTHGLLVFNRIPLSDMLAELARAYDVEIRVSDSVLAKQQMRMDVSVTEQSITSVLDLIAKVTDAHYTRAGRGFVLSPGRAAERAEPSESRRRSLSLSEPQYGK